MNRETLRDQWRRGQAEEVRMTQAADDLMGSMTRLSAELNSARDQATRSDIRRRLEEARRRWESTRSARDNLRARNLGLQGQLGYR